MVGTQGITLEVDFWPPHTCKYTQTYTCTATETCKCTHVSARAHDVQYIGMNPTGEFPTSVEVLGAGLLISSFDRREKSQLPSTKYHQVSTIIT